MNSVMNFLQCSDEVELALEGINVTSVMRKIREVIIKIRHIITRFIYTLKGTKSVKIFNDRKDLLDKMLSIYLKNLDYKESDLTDVSKLYTQYKMQHFLDDLEEMQIIDTTMYVYQLKRIDKILENLEKELLKNNTDDINKWISFCNFGISLILEYFKFGKVKTINGKTIDIGQEFSVEFDENSFSY